MTAYPFQVATLIGCVILLPLIWACLWMRVITWQLAGLLLFVATMYLAFYVWLFWLALPKEYAWLSAAMRTIEIFVAVGALSAIIWCNRIKVSEHWKSRSS